MLVIYGVAMDEAPNLELRSKAVGSNPQSWQQFFNPEFAKNHQGSLSQGNSNLKCPYSCLWRNSDNAVDRASTLPKSILHKIIALCSGLQPIVITF